MSVPLVLVRNLGSAFPEITKLKLEEMLDLAGTWTHYRHVRDETQSKDPGQEGTPVTGAKPCHSSPFVPFFFAQRHRDAEDEHSWTCSLS